MQLRDHMKSTQQHFGDEFQELHIALDDYYMTFRSSLHWVILHHQLGIEKMVERFGDNCRAAAEIHIKDDFGFVPTDPTDPRLLKHVYFTGPRDLEHAEEVLEKVYGKFFDFEVAYDDFERSLIRERQPPTLDDMKKRHQEWEASRQDEDRTLEFYSLPGVTAVVSQILFDRACGKYGKLGLYPKLEKAAHEAHERGEELDTALTDYLTELVQEGV